MTTSVADAGETWFVLQRGHYAGQALMRGSARVQVENGGYSVIAWMRSKKQIVPVWRGIDPFRGGEVAGIINDRTGRTAAGVPVD